MAHTKIRGYRWTMNYRGFDIHHSEKTGWFRAVPDNNLLAKDLATEDHYHVSNDGDMIIAMINDHFEVLEAIEALNASIKASEWSNSNIVLLDNGPSDY